MRAQGQLSLGFDYLWFYKHMYFLDSRIRTSLQRTEPTSPPWEASRVAGELGQEISLALKLQDSGGETKCLGALGAADGGSGEVCKRIGFSGDRMRRHFHLRDGSRPPASMRRGKMTGNPPRRFAPRIKESS